MGEAKATAQQKKQAAAVTLMAALVEVEREFVTKGILAPMELATGLRLYADEVMSRGSFTPFAQPATKPEPRRPFLELD